MIQDLIVGDGRAPGYGDTCTIHYSLIYKARLPAVPGPASLDPAVVQPYSLYHLISFGRGRLC